MAVPRIFKDFKLGRAAQSTFGTAPVAGAAVTFLNVEPVGIAPVINFREGNTAGGMRHIDEKDINVDTNEVAPEFTITGPVEKLEIPFLMYAFFQNVSEGGATTYAKTFTFASTQPDFAANAGFFCAFILRAVTDSYDRMIIDCVCKELKFSCDPAGRLMFTATFISRGAVDLDFNSTGTWTRNAGTFYHHAGTGSQAFRHTLNSATFGGATTIILTGGWELTFTQDVMPYGQSGSGSFYSYVISNRRAKYSANVLWDTNSNTIATDLVAGNDVDLRIGWGNATPGTDDADLDFALHGYIQNAPIITEAPAGINLEIMMAGEEGVTEPITAIVADSVSQGW